MHDAVGLQPGDAVTLLRRALGTILRKLLRLTSGVAVSLGCLYVATRGTDWAGVRAVLGAATPGWILAMVVAAVGVLAVRAQRWRVLLRPVGVVPFVPALSATAIGFGASAVLPLRLGEIVRPALLSRRCGVGLSGALSSIVLERMFDVVLVIGCFLVAGLVYEFPLPLRRAAAGLGALAVAGFLGLLVMLRHRARAELLVERWLPGRAAGTIGPLLHGFLEGLTGLADAGTVASVLGYSVVLWGVSAVAYTFGLRALDVPGVPLVAGSLITMVTVVAFIFLPQGPGFVGTWQAGCVLALGLFGTPRDVAVGYSFLTWITIMGTNLLVGMAFLVSEGLSLGQLLSTRTQLRA